MSTRRILVSVLVAIATSVACLATVRDAAASTYPTNKCVSSKIKAAETKCKALLKAWSTWDGDQNDAARDAALAAAATAFLGSWSSADMTASAAGVDCADTTATCPAMEATIDAAVTDIVNSINAGLNLADPLQGACGAKLLKAAATKCDKFLKAESKFVGKPAKDPHAAKRDLARDTASAKFATAWAGVTGCPTTATVTDIEDKIDELVDAVVTDTTVSPNVPTSWTMIAPGAVDYEGKHLEPICSRGTPYVYFVKRGTENKLLVYYQGGGACWDQITCADATGAFADEADASDNPALVTTGFGDLTNPANPFKDWNAVFVSYCTGDVHWGDNKKVYFGGPPYGNVVIEHRGFVNAKVVEKWAREHFVNPSEVFVTGSSAGAYGAILHGLLLPQVYPASEFSVLADAGNGVITPTFLADNLDQSWNVQANLPTFIPALVQPITSLTIVQLWTAGAAFYPDTKFAQYTSAWDGGLGSQSFFYNVMVNGILDALNWWHSSCSWDTQMRQYAVDTAAGASNYHYYIGAGSRHTIWGSNKVYSDTIGGVPIFVDWVNQMIARNPAWTDANCADGGDCDPLVGDAAPSPLQAPFSAGGARGVMVTCP